MFSLAPTAKAFFAQKISSVTQKEAESNLNPLLSIVSTKFGTKGAMLMLRKENQLAYAGVNQRAQQ